MTLTTLARWIPWLASVALLTIVLAALVVTDPDPPRHVHNLNPIFYPEPEPRPGYALAKVQVGSRNIPAYTLTLEDLSNNPRPAVILIHGGGITDLIEYANPQYKGEWFIPRYEHVPYSLAEAGFLVVAIDAWWAGERYRPEYAEIARDDTILAIFRAWVRTRTDVSTVVDELLSRDDVDPERIAVAGWSGGGITSLMAITKDDRIAAALAWKAGPDFLTKIEARGQSMLVDDSLDTNPEFIELLRREDPIYYYDRIPPRAVALIGNREDPAMPRQLAENFVEKLRPYYHDNPEHLLLSLYETPKPTHDLAPEPLVEGCRWLINVLGRHPEP